MLTLSRITRHFGGLAALEDVSFEVPAGQIVGLIGPNGAGKTTLLNVVSRLIPVTSGRIQFQGRDITEARPHEVVQLGMARTFQNIRLYRDMTVRDNVTIGQHVHLNYGLHNALLPLRRRRRLEAEARARTDELLVRLGIAHYADMSVGALPYGDQRRVEIARALASHPRLLLFDEPSAGMSSREAADFGALLCWLRGEGYTILLVAHDMTLVMGCCDHIVVLNFGNKIAEGDPDAVRQSPQVIEAYLGTRKRVGLGSRSV